MDNNLTRLSAEVIVPDKTSRAAHDCRYERHPESVPCLVHTQMNAIADRAERMDLTGAQPPPKLRAGKMARAEAAQERMGEEQIKLLEKIALDAMKDKTLAEERAEKLREMVEVKIDSKYETVDAPSPRSIMSRPLAFSILCIVVLMTTVIVLAMKLNQMM